MTSCEFWQVPVRDYLERWTSEVAIMRFEVDGNKSYYDKDGNLCVPSEEEVRLNLFMINPYHYNYATDYTSKIPESGLGPEIPVTADLNDTTVLHMTYPTSFLKEHDAGMDIGSTIELEHPVNPTTKSFTFSLKCNSKPPVIDAAIMTTTSGDNQTYVLAFYQPDTTLCQGIHKDIVSLTINGTTYPLSIGADGYMSFEDARFKRTRPSLAPINRKFEPSGLAIYFMTGEPTVEGDKIYTMVFTDSAGLQTSTTVDASLPRISAPTVLDSNNQELSLSEVNTAKIQEGENSIKVKIIVPTTDEIDQELEGEGQTSIKWEIYRGENKISPTDGTTNSAIADKEIELSKGDYTLSVWATRAGYKDSAKVSYPIKVIANHIYVKNTGNDTSGDGSEDSPYATIDKAVIELASYGLSGESYTVHILGTVVGSQSILGILDGKATKLYLKGEGIGILDGNSTWTPLKIFTTVPVEISSLKITGGNATEGAGIWAGGGTNLTLSSGVEISGNTATNNGGGIFTGGTLYVKTGCTIKSNTASNGGGIYKTTGGTVNIEGGSVGENGSANTAAKGAGIYMDNGTLNITSGTIGYNSATNQGGAVYSRTAVNISGGAVTGNKVTAANGLGGAIYALANVNISDSADLKGSSSSEKNNDVYLSSGKYINVIDTPSTDVIAAITPYQWKRGSQVLSGSVTEATCSKFSMTKTSWTVTLHDSKGKIDAPLYVSESGNDETNSGTQTEPYKTVSKAAGECWNSETDYVINISGEVKGKQEIPTTVTTSKAKSIKLLGISNGTLNAQGSNSNKKRALTIKTSVPVKINSLKLTGGYQTNGGGLYVDSNATVKLEDGTQITGNQATTSGGGVYVAGNATLFLYGTAIIGDSTMAPASSTEFANKATNYGGGIYNLGTVYIGYSASGTPSALSGGIKRNYGGCGGGIYNAANGTVVMNTGNISYNKANYGGALYGAGSSTTEKSTSELRGGTFTSNEASSFGGAVYLALYGLFKVQGSPSLQSSEATKNDIYLAQGSDSISSITLTGAVTGGLLKISLPIGNWVMSRVLKPESGDLPAFGSYIGLIDSSNYKINSKGYILSSSQIKSISTKEELKTACDILSSGDNLTLCLTATITPDSDLIVPSGARLILNRSTNPNDDVNSGTMSYMLNLNNVTIGSSTSGRLILDGEKSINHSCYAPLIATIGNVTLHNVLLRNNDSTKTPPEGIDNPGNAGHGGAVYMKAGTNLTLDNCTIINCKAKNGGGIGGYGTLQVNSNCTLSNCTATDNGGFLELAATVSSSSFACLEVTPTGCSATNGKIAYLATSFDGYVAQLEHPNGVLTATMYQNNSPQKLD
ncbi:MAG: hypothetical protein J5857_11070 [Treponema sp.]|nr:hypothetical protein [Treponema sp.]